MDDGLAGVRALLPGSPVEVLEQLGGSTRSHVRRVRAGGRTLIVKEFTGPGEGWARECAALSVLPPEVPAPRLVASAATPPIVVMSDLGPGSNVADLLLGADRAAAVDAVLAWAAAVGSLHRSTTGLRQAFQEALAARSGDLTESTVATTTASSERRARLNYPRWRAWRPPSTVRSPTGGARSRSGTRRPSAEPGGERAAPPGTIAPVDVPELLRQAAGELPAGLPRADLDDYLAQDEWETTLEVLLDQGDEFPATTSFFQTLEEAADRMGLHRSAAWCAWRRREVLHGVIRAELRLVPGAFHAAIPGAGVARALWDIGLVTPAGAPDLAVAAIWVEFAPDLPPGGAGPVRLAPVTALRWDHLQPGDRITMYARNRVGGSATLTQVPGRR